jgi:ribosomal protein L14E/L6E/L27E
MAKKRDVNRFRAGQMALSDAGHDRGKLYVILGVQDETVWLADGLRKTVEKPKKKNIRHVRRMNYIDPEIEARLDGEYPLNNEDIMKAIQLFEAKCKVIGG